VTYWFGQEKIKDIVMLNYSIIIPHRDIPQLLQRCLDSIPQRPDLEVIVVDDNSNPEVVDFDHFPGMERPNTTVIFDKSGKGAGRVRNIGLEHAKGKWLLFADADDFFNYCLNDVLDEYADNDSDIIFFRISSVDSVYYVNSDRDGFYNAYFEEYLDNRIEGEKQLRYVSGVPWGKLVRREMVTSKNIKFQETTIHNDTKFGYLTGYYANNIAVDLRAIYCLTYRQDSISYTLTDDKIIESIRVLAERERFMVDHNIYPAFKHLNWELIDDLISFKKGGKEEIYYRSLKIFSNFSFPNVMIEEMIEKRLLQIRNKNRRQVVDTFLIKINKTLFYPFRSLLYTLFS
jgi:glycosyltransferase involved in cell wall biosynthesis